MILFYWILTGLLAVASLVLVLSGQYYLAGSIAGVAIYYAVILGLIQKEK